MASGDVVLEMDALPVHLNAITDKNPSSVKVLVLGLGGNSYDLNGNPVYAVVVSTDATNSPFDTTKTYDVIIKEH